MANAEQLAILKQGVEGWNEWRKKREHSPVDDINLNFADLRGANLVGVDFSGVNLIGAKLNESDLRRANLIGANLNRANLSGANLSGPVFRHLEYDHLETKLEQAELGIEGLDEFRETKHVHWDFNLEDKSYWYPYGR